MEFFIKYKDFDRLLLFFDYSVLSYYHLLVN